MGSPRLTEKRWSVDLEKRIQETHDEEKETDIDSIRHLAARSSSSTHLHPIQVAHGTSVRSRSTA